MPIEDALDTARDQAADFLNAEGRDWTHVALGLALTAGFALAATTAASRLIRPQPRRALQPLGGDAPITERPRGPISLILPAMFSATTLSAVRVWNAPARPERRTAMALWIAAQAVSAVWLAVRPTRLTTQIAAAMSSAGLAAAFAHEARKLDPAAGKLASPTGMGVRLANRAEARLRGDPIAS
ncbi:tryptophan-rich sensory protein [Brevundimonas bullata]|uniref:Tryptophan-rich sensory protein n=1 Tax=Brevundimonas bullata TaxID=13160 RepID=A0A7W7IR97_9CAUL|nr:TspO protein [Brevundimonas bullata]MBB4798868.1 tryptophan-rich sensory protein [Brevundimonas bullata]MBB6383828.1 tryptophan-rich sensory protein [Brevundimonas bullata]